MKKERIMKMTSNASSLYVHIPFCRQICSYCDFAKVIYQDVFISDYFQSLFFELESFQSKKYKTIYIGGGTPSCLPLPILENLLIKLTKLLYKNNYEFSIECNVEDITTDLLTLLKKYGVNRISIGVQTFQKKWIQLCGRTHTLNQAIQNIQLASAYFENINIDMIYALPYQTLIDLKNDLSILLSLPIQHISYYSLIIEKNTIFYRKFEDMDDVLQAKMYRLIYQQLKKSGFYRYEISNFAKKGFQCKHNLVYWTNQHYDAVGLNASGYQKNMRYTNTRNLTLYNQKNYQKEWVYLTKEDQIFEEIMLHFRLDKGLSFQNFQKKFQLDFLKTYHDVLIELLEKKLVRCTKTHIQTTWKGSLLLNQILEKFLK